MRDATQRSRRSFLAGTGAVVLTAVAGCQGDDGGPQGETSPVGTDGGGAGGTDTTLQIRGQQVRSETITGETEWEFDLARGDTLTAVVEPTGATATGVIHQFERTGHLAEANSAPGNPDTMQHTAENEATYVVEISLHRPPDREANATVEAYVASG